jgi:hypothetical protein
VGGKWYISVAVIVNTVRATDASVEYVLFSITPEANNKSTTGAIISIKIAHAIKKSLELLPKNPTFSVNPSLSDLKFNILSFPDNIYIKVIMKNIKIRKLSIYYKLIKNIFSKNKWK